MRSKVFVFEMNNEENKIMGVGYLYNKSQHSKKYRIYENMDYNRFSYISKYRIDRYELDKDDKAFLKKVEKHLFYGYSHQKRGHGFNCISVKNLKHIKTELKKWIIHIFIKKYISL
jgi:hypothetical protein